MKKIGKFLRKHIFIVGYIIAILLIVVKLPYYIDTPGGLIDVSDRIEIDGGYSSSGSLNLAYVTEYEATIPLLLLSYILPDWDIYPITTSTSTETYEDTTVRDKIWMEEAYSNAVILAYLKAEKEIEITNTNIYVLYVYEDADTDLEVGDKILSVDGEKVSSKSELTEYIQTKEVGETVSIEVKNNKKTYTRYAEIKEIDDLKYIGIYPAIIREYQTTPSITIHYGDSESGPSGGLMLSLAIYNMLTEKDITGGLTIVGTGTIDEYGNVGEIGGVAYKLKGAVKKKADIFFVPSGENYEEAMDLKKKKNYDITIVPVSTFDEALEYLKKNVQ